LRILVETYRPRGDVYESLIFRKNLFAPQTGSPIIEYPQGGDLVSKDGVVYLANDWFPILEADRPVEVVTLLGVEFHQFSLPKAPVAAVEPPAEPPVVPVGVTGFAALPLDLTQDLMDASGAPEASDEDADEWRVPHPGDVGSIIQVRDADSGWRWTDRKLLAIIPEDLDNPNRGSFVCATKDETTICFAWKFARIAKQKPAWEPQPGDCIRVAEGSLKGHFGVVLSGARPRADQSWEPEVEDNLDYRWIWIPKLGPWTNRVHKRTLAPA
jgi:hypothetical protein